MSESTMPTILVVDDTEATRYAVARTLRKAGFAIEEAATGAEALRMMSARPELVVLDISLPDMTGYDVCRQIKANPITASIPILHLSSSFVESENRSEGLETGADGYLTYPLEPRELLANVQALLRVRKAEQEVRQQRELLRVTLGSIADGVIATDGSGKVTFINAAAEALTGWPAAESLDRDLADIFCVVNERTGEPVEDPVARILKTGQVEPPTNHQLLVARDGNRRPVDEAAAPIRDDRGRSVGVVLVFRDVSERRRLEEEIRRQMDDLAERDRRKDEFLAMLGHELRNPLAPLRNCVEYLRVAFGKEPAFARTGEMMSRQLDHLIRLVDDLLDVSRVSRGKIELRSKLVDLGVAVSRTVESIRPVFDERRHGLELLLPREPIFVQADPDRLEQIVGNLLTNAAKYTSAGGRIEVEVRRDAEQAMVRVKDNGIGVRAEMLERIFDTFQQADRVAGRVAEGLGLGLSLVRRLVELHGGTVTASSGGPGQGSEFIVRLPVVEHAPSV
jgi:PAS domain S-box-containing protein